MKCNFGRRNRSKILRVGIHTLINYVWMREELPEQWKDYIIVPTYRKGDKTDLTNYWVISLFLTTFRILSNVFLSGLPPLWLFFVLTLPLILWLLWLAMFFWLLWLCAYLDHHHYHFSYGYYFKAKAPNVSCLVDTLWLVACSELFIFCAAKQEIHDFFILIYLPCISYYFVLWPANEQLFHKLS
jgi:hypothetical protein